MANTSPYTAERRGVLGNTSPKDQVISRGRGFCTLGPKDCMREKPEGRGVQNPRPREIPRSSGGVFPNISWLEAVYVQSLSIIVCKPIFCDCKLFNNSF